jgi:hypothetical protein
VEKTPRLLPVASPREVAPRNGAETFQAMDDDGEGGFGYDGFGDDAAMDADEPEVTHFTAC